MRIQKILAILAVLFAASCGEPGPQAPHRVEVLDAPPMEVLRKIVLSLSELPREARQDALAQIRESTGWAPQASDIDVHHFDSYVHQNEWRVNESLRFGYSAILSMIGRYASGDDISLELRSDGVSVVVIHPSPGFRYKGEGSWRFGAAPSEIVVNGVSPGLPSGYEAISGGTFARDVPLGALVGPRLGDGMQPILERL